MSELAPYPAGPGVKRQDYESTSFEAAREVAPKVTRQEDLALEVIDRLGRASPEEIVADLKARGIPCLLTSIRARCTGMFKRGALRPSGSYGRGESGKVRVIRWERVPAFELTP